MVECSPCWIIYSSWNEKSAYLISSANAKFAPICSETKVRQLRSSDMSSHKILTYFIGIVEDIQSVEIECLRWPRPFGLEKIALCKRVNKKKYFPTHYPLTFPLFLSIKRAKKLPSLAAVYQGFLITCSCFYLFFLSLYYRMCAECLLWVYLLLPESLQCYEGPWLLNTST